MDKYYKHTQVGYVPLIFMIAGMIIIIIHQTVNGFAQTAIVALAILGVALILVSSLTVTIKENVLEVRFGPGPIRKKIRISAIESCKIVKNPWYYGWGIRRIPPGQLYSVSGLSAVEIKLKRSGDKIRIGTDVPRALETAIRQAMEAKR
jgi:hypothetical protein